MALTNPIVAFDAALTGLLQELPYNIRWRWAAEELTALQQLPLVAIEYESFSEQPDPSTVKTVTKNLVTREATIAEGHKVLSVRYSLHYYTNKVSDLSALEWSVRRKLDELETETGIIISKNQTLILAPEKVDADKFYHAVMQIRAAIYGVATIERTAKLVITRDFPFHSLNLDGIPEVDRYTVTSGS